MLVMLLLASFFLPSLDGKSLASTEPLPPYFLPHSMYTVVDDYERYDLGVRVTW